MIKESFSTAELVRLSGLPSPHMVAYLCRSGILTPSLSTSRRRGLSRRFSFQDIVFAKVLAKLLEGGVSVTALRGVLRTLHRKLRLPPESLRSKQVVLAGKRVYLTESPNLITELTANGQLAFCFVLDIKELLHARGGKSSGAVAA